MVFGGHGAPLSDAYGRRPSQRSGLRQGATLSTNTLRQFASWAILTGLAMPAAIAWGQNVSPTPAGQSTTGVSPASIKLDAMLAESISRLAMLDLRVNESPATGDFRVAMLLFRLAEKYAPTDAELVRRRIEAASNAGDESALIDATKRLLVLDPKDTVAALRLISTEKIGSLQTAEDRLAAYDRFTSDAAGALDASIRSRLALDAALLCQERGDVRGFLDRLKLASTLDSTNKDAALLIYNWVGAATEDPKTRAEALSNLLYADPLDPNVHIRLAREFAKGGAYRAAERFHKNSREIISAGLPNPPFQLVVEMSVLEWMNVGAESVYTKLRDSLAARRAQAAKLIKEREEQLLDTSTMSKPEEEFLRMDLEPIRLCTALALHDLDSARATLRDLERAIAKNFTYARDPLRRPRELSEEVAVREAQAQSFTLQIWRAAVGIDVEKIDADLEEARKGMDTDDANVLAFESMYASRLGKPDEALAKIASPPMVTEWTEFARALALDLKGDIEGAVAAYRASTAAAPLSAIGAHALVRVRELTKSRENSKDEQQLRELTAELEKFAISIPAWVDEMITNPSSFQLFDVDVANPTAPVHEPLKMTLTLQNVSRIPLGLGAGRTLNSRVLFAPAVTVRGFNLRDFAFPEVLDLERRLRLKPGESIRVDVPLELGRTGWTIQTFSLAPVQVRWRAVQGFQVKEDGIRAAGPGCLEALSTAIVRAALAEARMSYDELVKRVDSAIEPDVPTLVMGVRSAMVTGARGIAEDERRKALVASLAARYPGLSPRLRSFVVLTMPTSSELIELEPLDAVIRQERDAEVLPFAIVTRCSKADDELVQSARSSGNLDLATLVDVHLSRLASGASCYATKGSGMAENARRFMDGFSLAPTSPKPNP